MMFYKTCIAQDGEYFSYSAMGKYELEYAIGRTTTPAPGTTWVAAWKTLAGARRFCLPGVDWIAILLCEGQLAQNQDPPLAPPVYEGDFDALWRGGQSGWPKFSIPGAAYCKWLKPISVVVPPVMDAGAAIA